MACKEVQQWVQDNVLTPVERFITAAREACNQIDTWVEEQVSQPVESWISREEQRCREESCNWWCLCCNKWFCWIVTVVVRVVTWVLVTVGRWVAQIVCQVVTVVVGIVVELVLKVILRLVTVLVCLFTEPLGALKAIWDLWNDIVDTVGDVIDLVTTLIDDAIGLLDDVADLLDGLGRSFCIFGDAMCAIFSAIFGFFSGVVRWAGDVLDWVRDVVTGVKDLVTGLLTGNWCRIQGGLRILNVLRVITSVTRIPAGWFYTGPEALIRKDALAALIDEAISNNLRGEALEKARGKVSLGGSQIGVPVKILPARLALRSSDLLWRLAREGVVNLHAIAGRVSDCGGKFIYDQFAGEVVYTGTTTSVTQSDLDRFMAEGPQAVASFTAYPITTDLFRRYLEVARRKGEQVGLRFTWPQITEVVVDDARFVPLQSDETGDAAQKALLALTGRPAADENLAEAPSISVFGYRETSLHGLTSWFRPPAASPTGTTFRTRFPEVAMRFVPIHEIGHYFGLDHTGHNSAKYIMWSPRESGQDWGAVIAEYGFLSGEANFSLDDARDVWRWITTTAQARDKILG